MQDVVDRAGDLDRLRDVVQHELEVGAAREVGDVLALAGDQVVDADDGDPLGEQPLAEVRAEEAGAAGDDRRASRAPPRVRRGAADRDVAEARGGDPRRAA